MIFANMERPDLSCLGEALDRATILPSGRVWASLKCMTSRFEGFMPFLALREDHAGRQSLEGRTLTPRKLYLGSKCANSMASFGYFSAKLRVGF